VRKKPRRASEGMAGVYHPECASLPEPDHTAYHVQGGFLRICLRRDECGHCM